MKEYIKDYEKKEYFSQNREDLILSAFFQDKRDGFYIDVGGFDPDYDSVTKYFYKRGWRGVNIEPQPEKFKRFVKKRTRDINIQEGISDKSGMAKLRVYKSGGLSTLSKKLQDQYRVQPSEEVNSFRDVEIRISTLAEVLDQFKIPNVIDFMKVDVEGFEYGVLAGNNWQKYKPTVICIESNHVEKDWRPILRKNDYEMVFFDGLNDYYCQKNSQAYINFDYVEHVVIRKGGGIHHKDLDKIKEMNKIIDNYATQYKKDIEKVKRLEDELEAKRLILNNPSIMIWRGIKKLIRIERTS